MTVILVPRPDDEGSWALFQDADKIEAIAMGECKVGEPLPLVLDLIPGSDFTRCRPRSVVSFEKTDFDPVNGPPDDALVRENRE